MILRRIIAGILSVAMMMCFLPLQQFTPILQEIIASASAAEVVASGECGADGDNLTWTLDDKGVMIINGQGDMRNYDLDNRPWELYKHSIIEVIINNGVTSIGDYAFWWCENITSVTISDGVTSIGCSSFELCKSLVSVDIPNSVINIGPFAFYCCYNIKSITIPDNVTCIGGDAFSSCVSLSSISLGGNVTSIGSFAFMDCSALSSIVIPDSVASIGDCAFLGCVNLSSIIIPNRITDIVWQTFSGCKKIVSITISNNVESIDEAAFYDCESLTDIYYTGTEEEWNAITINSENECLTSAKIHFNHVEDVPSIAFGTINGLKWTLTNEGVLTISGSGLMGLDDANTAPWMKYADKITEVVIEDGVMDIGKAAFSGCMNLTSVTIPDSVYSIKQGAFKDCKSLTSVIIPNGISEIQAEVFSGCVALLGIHIPRSVITVEENAFYGCSALTNIYYGGIPTDRSAVSIDAAASNVIDLMNLEWHYLDEYYYSDVEQKIYEQMRTLCDKPTYYGNSQTVDIVKDYRNMAIADPEVESYSWWTNFNDVLDGKLTEEEFNETMTVEALMTEIFLNERLIESFDRNTAEAVWNANKDVLTGIKNNSVDWGVSDDSLNTIDTLLSATDYSTEFVDESTMKVYSILAQVNGQKLSAFETMLKELAENSEAIGAAGTCFNLFSICYDEHQSKVENATQLYNLYLICVAYHSSSAQFQQAVQFMSESITLEMNKYTADDEFAQRMRKVGAMYQEYYKIMLDESMMAYQDFAAELDAETEFNRNFQLATFGAKEIAIGAIAVACPYAAPALKTAGLALDVGISLWEITSEVDERSLERDKFLNMIPFYDSFSNALYSNEGFFGLLLDDPSETSYQTFVNGIQIYLVAEEMIIDYAVNYSRLLKPALKDWKNSVFTLVDVSLYVKEVYRARYPDRSTSGRSVISCWKELNADMSDDDAQLLRFKHVFIDNGDFTGLRHLYYITDEEAQELGEKSCEKYQKLKEKVEIYNIFCPVNLAIRHGDEIIAKVENDTITLDSDEIFLNIYKEADDEYAYKYVILPEGYTLEITGFYTGTMSFEKATIENGNVTTISTITDIHVQNGSSYIEVIEDNVTVALECDLDSNGVTDEILTAEVTESVFAQGDVDGNGQVDISDATAVLTMYAKTAADLPIDEYTEIQKKSADVDGDSLITISDATYILAYYAQNAAGLNPSWDKILA